MMDHEMGNPTLFATFEQLRILLPQFFRHFFSSSEKKVLSAILGVHVFRHYQWNLHQRQVTFCLILPYTFVSGSLCHSSGVSLMQYIIQNDRLWISQIKFKQLRNKAQLIFLSGRTTKYEDQDLLVAFIYYQLASRVPLLRGYAVNFKLQSVKLVITCQQYQLIHIGMEMMENGEQEPKIGITEEQIKNVSEVLSVDQPQSKWKRFCNNVKVVKINLIAEALRIGIYLLVAFGIFYAFERTTHISLRQQTYFSSEQVVYASQIRGLFPPIQGSHIRLIGKWKVSFTNSLEIANNEIYNNFTVEFKSNNNIRIKRRGCDGDLFMNWHTFQYNMFIKDYNNEDMDREMVIQPERNDTICITEDSKFIDHLRSVSVWTIYDDNLYLLAETWRQPKNMQYILLLQQIY